MADLSPEAKEFADLLRAAGWSQSEAARKLMISAPHVNQIVNGVAQPSRALIQLTKLTIMAEKPKALTAKADYPSSGSHVLREERPAWENELIEEIRQLNADDRDNVLIGLKAFLRIGKKGQAPNVKKRAA